MLTAFTTTVCDTRSPTSVRFFGLMFTHELLHFVGSQIVLTFDYLEGNSVFLQKLFRLSLFFMLQNNCQPLAKASHAFSPHVIKMICSISINSFFTIIIIRTLNLLH